MRRLLSIAAAGVLALALAAPAMAGANTSNTSGSAQIVNGEWSSETGSGYAYFATDSSYGPSGEFYEESGEWIACDDTGESYGFVGTRTYGYASDVSIALDSRLDHATVTGTLELSSETVNDCTGGSDTGKYDTTNGDTTASRSAPPSTAWAALPGSATAAASRFPVTTTPTRSSRASSEMPRVN